MFENILIGLGVGLAAICVLAAAYDWRARKHGRQSRSTREMMNETADARHDQEAGAKATAIFKGSGIYRL